MPTKPQMTVLEILNRTKVFFEKKGVPDARLDAEYIICFGLGIKKRMDLYLNFDKPLSEAELDKLRPLVARRASREPLQHIVGDTRSSKSAPGQERLQSPARRKSKAPAFSPPTFQATRSRSRRKTRKPTASAKR